MNALQILAMVLAAIVVAVLLVRYAFRPWERRWGATPAEAGRKLPGDERLPQTRFAATRAITIRAPANRVWPWLAQLGQGRGGLYSYDRLENLVGCDIHSVDRVVPELQPIAVGDVIRMHRSGMPSFVVVAVQPGEWLLLATRDPSTGQAVSLRDAGPLASEGTWLFLLEPIDAGTTRLIVRTRSTWRPTLGDRIVWEWLVEPISFVMERGMLKGIRARAERRG